MNKQVFKVVSGLGGLTFLLSGLSLPANGEGSKDLIETGQGDRPYLEFTTDLPTGGIPRQAILRVFAQTGETIYLGSSVPESYVDPEDIILRSPSGQQLSCDVDRDTGEGFIDTLAKEQAGPAINGNGDGYLPCEFDDTPGFTVTETGIYEVEFRSPLGNTGFNPDTVNVAEPFPTDDAQGKAVAAWDITVADDNNIPISGRVFAEYIPFNVGSSGRSNTEVFVVTLDGYRYRFNTNGIQPFGFILFGSSRGFIDTDGTTLYHSVVDADQGNNVDPLVGGVEIQLPTQPNNIAENRFTHPIFLNPPDSLALQNYEDIEGNPFPIPLDAIPPPQPDNFAFVGNGEDNRTPEESGGRFTFDTSFGGSVVLSASYSIIIDTNQDGIFNSDEDVVIEDTLFDGTTGVEWDGLDRNGNPIPEGKYQAQINVRAGEYHFPLLDVEDNQNGLIVQLTNPPFSYSELQEKFPNVNEFTIYYDDRDYVTADGTSVSLGGGTVPQPLSALSGIDSEFGAHRFSGNFGNEKGIDTWAFFPSSAVQTTEIVIFGDSVPNVEGSKSVRFLTDVDESGTVTVGDEIQYTLTYTNSGDADADELIITDDLPSQLTFQTAEIVNQTNGNTITLNPDYDGSGALTQAGVFGVNEALTITITATINDANNGNSIENQAVADFVNPDGTPQQVLTDADSDGGTTETPNEGDPFVQIDDDGQDTGNDGNLTGDDDLTLIEVTPTTGVGSSLRLVKRITAINGESLTGYVDNPDDTDDDESLSWPNPISESLRGSIEWNNFQSGDIVEYTLYFLSDGSRDVANLRVCDLIPTGTTFIPNSFNPQAGIALALNETDSPTPLTNENDNDSGEFFPANTTPSLQCLGDNTNGAIVVSPENLSPNTYGLIRFQVRVD